MKSRNSDQNKLAKLKKFKPYDPMLMDTKLIKSAICKALIENDLQTVRDILIAHLQTVNKLKLSKETQIGRQTLYDLMNPDKEFNPTIKTLSAILDQLAA